MQYWVSPALVFFINLCMNWSHCHDAETSSPLHAASAPPILSPSWIWQVSLILQSSESLSVIKYAAGAALYVGITLPSGAVCHSNVATKKWWMERHFWSSLPDKLSVLGGRVFKRTAFGRKGPDQLCFYQSIWLESAASVILLWSGPVCVRSIAILSALRGPQASPSARERIWQNPERSFWWGFAAGFAENPSFHALFMHGLHILE